MVLLSLEGCSNGKSAVLIQENLRSCSADHLGTRNSTYNNESKQDQENHAQKNSPFRSAANHDPGAHTQDRHRHHPGDEIMEPGSWQATLILHVFQNNRHNDEQNRGTEKGECPIPEGRSGIRKGNRVASGIVDIVGKL